MRIHLAIARRQSGGSRRTRRLVQAAAVGLLAATASPALAGPPYATDDPEPTDVHHWELYAFVGGERFKSGFEGASGFDINYGAAPDLQLTATVPLDFSREPHSFTTGAGDLELGAKYRFFHREESGVSVAIFPRVILPTAGRRFGSGKVGLLLPVWAQKDMGDWSLFGGGGYAINPGRGNRNFVEAGAALTRAISERLSIGAEITHESADAKGGRGTTALGFGGIYRLHGPFSLLAAGGPTLGPVRDGPRFNVYAALGMSF
jgi:hypothetical protein